MEIRDKRSYETFVFDTLKQELKEERLGIIAKDSKIFKGKGYYSKDRGSKIKIDVSIEVTRKGAKEYSLLIVVECKKYAQPINVSEIEEFYAKVNQIAGLNVKAIVITNTSLQKSALKYAMAKNIAVIRLFRDGEVDWIINNGAGSGSKITRRALDRAFFNEVYRPTNRDFYACNKHRMFGSWDRLLKYYLRHEV